MFALISVALCMMIVRITANKCNMQNILINSEMIARHVEAPIRYQFVITIQFDLYTILLINESPSEKKYRLWESLAPKRIRQELPSWFCFKVEVFFFR